MNFYFQYNNEKFYSLLSFCNKYDVRYSSAKYLMRSYAKNKQEIIDFIANNPEILNVMIDKYSGEKKG